MANSVAALRSLVGRTCKMPGNMPAFSANLLNANAVKRVSLGGLMTTAQPAANAGAILRPVFCQCLELEKQDLFPEKSWSGASVWSKHTAMQQQLPQHHRDGSRSRWAWHDIANRPQRADESVQFALLRKSHALPDVSSGDDSKRPYVLRERP